jgi:predicted amidohydrolase
MTIKKSPRPTRIVQTVYAALTTLLLMSFSDAAEPGAGKSADLENRMVRIAVVQLETKPGAVDENRAKAVRFAREALGKGADGVVADYRKTHLWWRAEGVRHEPTFFQPGNKLVTFDVKGHKTGLMICYDGDFPEMTRAYANLDCTMLLWLNNRGSRGHREVAPLARANTMIMATSCCCGKNEAGKQCGGGSNITDKSASLVAEIWDKEGIIYADVDPGTVAAARDENPWFRGQRQDLYR